MAELFKTAGLFSQKNAAFALVVAHMDQDRMKLRRKRLWQCKWLARRPEKSLYYQLVQELALEDEESYRNWMRLSKAQFFEVLQLIEPIIKKKDTHFRKAVTPEERLALTLRHLATGESQSSLAYQFRISQALISSIIPDVCTAIYDTLQPKYMVVPTTEDGWKNIARGFYSKWNFPNCIGALDGKRVLIQKPAKSGSQYYDYKGHFSIIMMALVDWDLKFIFLDVGCRGRASDAGVWNKCVLYEALESNSLHIPAPCTLPMSDTESPFVVVGDDAFPLKKYLLKPYPGHDLGKEKIIFNYRLSRARRVSENAFGILAARFQIFKHPINCSPNSVCKIVKASVVIHNYLKVTSKHSYSPVELIDREDTDHHKITRGQWRQYVQGGLENLKAVPRKPAADALNARDKLMKYFNSDGKVHWQDEMALLH